MKGGGIGAYYYFYSDETWDTILLHFVVLFVLLWRMTHKIVVGLAMIIERAWSCDETQGALWHVRMEEGRYSASALHLDGLELLFRSYYFLLLLTPVVHSTCIIFRRYAYTYKIQNICYLRKTYSGVHVELIINFLDHVQRNSGLFEAQILILKCK